jgi:SAM-dependent methyltransferase
MIAIRKVRPILRGLRSYLPGFDERMITGGAATALYCYAVWLRHLHVASAHGLVGIPQTVVELGPGDSLGTGMAAVISGASRYTAMDIAAFAARTDRCSLFDELVEFFRIQRPIPEETEVPGVRPHLTNYRFPADVLTPDWLDEALAETRLAIVREQLAGADLENGSIRYLAPWHGVDDLEAGSVDFLFSQAVLEHVDDLEFTYKQMHRWLRQGGFASHEIDFRSHDIIQPWNAHLSFSDIAWRAVRGRWTYMLNRASLSVHLSLLEHTGFRIVNIDIEHRNDGLPPDKLAPSPSFLLTG